MLQFLLPVLFTWSIYAAPWLVGRLGRVAGWHLRRRTHDRRALIVARVRAEEAELEGTQKSPADDDDWENVERLPAGAGRDGDAAAEGWDGVIGFFHPFCNAGGGGERVLWAAIRATQRRWPRAICVVYTGDHDVDKAAMLSRVQTRFNIDLHPPTVVFLYLSTRRYVLSQTYARLTLLGQSLGSLVLAHDAFTLLVPDIFVDTMGYAFALALCDLLFPDVPTAAYVHYPTISTDMLGSLDAGDGHGVNAGAGKGWRGVAKRRYWQLFAALYGWVGGKVDVVMTNSSWTQAHIRALWGASRTRRGKTHAVDVVFPPVAVDELERQIETSAASEARRERIILYIAQFRPEKNHTLILQAFAQYRHTAAGHGARLVLVGSVRHSDDATRVYKLRLLAHELKVKDAVEFVCDASWPEILEWLRRSWVGVNGMWNEHFGIGVVEYQAAGLISVVHDSGGPKGDIVVEWEGGPTGFHATTADEYAAAFEAVLAMAPADTLAMRRRARASARRFTEEAFASRWVGQMERLVELRKGRRGRA
ncbi:MAG: asparagine-linked glycosylation protein [Thelocarpon impressellum]|nr:MAG: asparagine-linked glycosylation protein [Thelocarpon impressellum]